MRHLESIFHFQGIIIFGGVVLGVVFVESQFIASLQTQQSSSTDSFRIEIPGGLTKGFYCPIAMPGDLNFLDQ